jgi:hypothetical protein
MRAPAARWIAFNEVCFGKRFSGQVKKWGEAVDPLRPVCPFYLRDCGADVAAPGAPSVGRRIACAASLQMRIASAQSSLPERLRELRLRRRRDREVDAALSCTDR